MNGINNNNSNNRCLYGNYIVIMEENTCALRGVRIDIFRSEMS